MALFVLSVVEQRLDAVRAVLAGVDVLILARDLRVPIAELSGSDIAFDVHLQRVFLRTQLA